MMVRRSVFTRTSVALVLLALLLLGLAAAPSRFPAPGGTEIGSTTLPFGGRSPEPVPNPFGYYDRTCRVDRDGRITANVYNDVGADFVEFSEARVIVSLSRARTLERCFQKAPQRVLSDFGYAEGWRADRNRRIVTDGRNHGGADLVGFADTGVWVSLTTYTATSAGFRGHQPLLDHFGYSAGGWRVDRGLPVIRESSQDGPLYAIDMVLQDISGLCSADRVRQ